MLYSLYIPANTIVGSYSSKGQHNIFVCSYVTLRGDVFIRDAVKTSDGGFDYFIGSNKYYCSPDFCTAEQQQ